MSIFYGIFEHFPTKKALEIYITIFGKIPGKLFTFLRNKFLIFPTLSDTFNKLYHKMDLVLVIQFPNWILNFRSLWDDAVDRKCQGLVIYNFVGLCRSNNGIS